MCVFTDCVPQRRRVLCLVWSLWLNPIFMFHYIYYFLIEGVVCPLCGFAQLFWVNNCIYKIYPTISKDQNCRNIYTYEWRKIRVSVADKNCTITFWCISRKRLARSYWIPNSRIIQSHTNAPSLFFFHFLSAYWSYDSEISI